MKRIRLMLLAAVAAPLLLVGSAMAETASPNSGSNDKTTSGDTVKKTETENETEHAAEGAEKTAAQRLADYKGKLKTKLGEVEQKRIIAKCKNGQVVVKALHGREESIKENRGKIHTAITERVATLITKLKAQNVDVTALETANTAAKVKADKLQTDLATYKQTLTDLQGMDCANDPTGFKAALEVARTQREQVAKDAADYRTYVHDVLIKKALKDVKATLDATKTEDKAKTTEDTGGTH